MNATKQMNPEEAIALIDQVLAEVPLKRNMNGMILVAVSIIRGIVTKQPRASRFDRDTKPPNHKTRATETDKKQDDPT